MPTDRKLPERYFIVLGPTEKGPHRLLIREGGALRRYPAAAGSRASLPPGDAAASLQGTSIQERPGAIADLRKAMGYGFQFQVESGAVIGLTVSTGGNAEEIDSS